MASSTGAAAGSNRRLSKTKTFNDAVHGVIELHPLSVRIIDTVEFQRLRDLKQLGGAYTVYPSASHNRFEHSLGVAHLARTFVRRLAASLQTGIGEAHEGVHVTEADMVCVEIAGLIHDLGHGILSHMFDQKYIQHYHPGAEWEHEHASVDMFEHLIRAQSLRRFFEEAGLDFDRDVRFIQELVLGKPMASHAKFHTFEWSRGNKKRFLYEIVANKRNGIDVDKWDYFQRDAQALGLATEFNLNGMRRLMMHARVMVDPSDRSADPVTCVAYDVKVAKELYGMFRARAHLHMTAYQHRVSRGIEVMYCEALIAAGESFTVPGEYSEGEKARMIEDGTWAGMKTGKPRRKMHESIHDMSAYSKLSDWVLKYLLTCPDTSGSGALDEGLLAASRILKRIHRRFLYKFLMEVSIPTRYSSDGDVHGNRLELGFLASQLDDARTNAEAVLARVLHPHAAIMRSPPVPGSATRVTFSIHGQPSSDEAAASPSLADEHEDHHAPPARLDGSGFAFTTAKATAPRAHERRAGIRDGSPPRARMSSYDPISAGVSTTHAHPPQGQQDEEPDLGGLQEEDFAAIQEGLSQLPVPPSVTSASSAKQSSLPSLPSTTSKAAGAGAAEGTVSKPPTGKVKAGTTVKSGSASAPPSTARPITDFFAKAAQVAASSAKTAKTATGSSAGATTVKAGDKRTAVGFSEDVEVIEPSAKREKLSVGAADAVSTPTRMSSATAAAAAHSSSSAMEDSSQATVPEAAPAPTAPPTQVRERGRAHPGLTEKDVKWVTTWIMTVANGMTEPLIKHAESQYQSYQEEQEALLMEEEGMLVSPLDAVEETASAVPGGIPSASMTTIEEEDSAMGASQPYPLPLSQVSDSYSQPPVPLSQMPADYSSTPAEASSHSASSTGELGAGAGRVGGGGTRSTGGGLRGGTGGGGATEPIRITEADFFVDLVNIDYGKKGKDPIEDVVAFSANKGGAGVRPVKISRKAQGEMVVPQVFRQQFIRIYSKRPENRRVTAMVHAAFVWFMEAFSLEPGLMPYYTPPVAGVRGRHG